MFYLQVLYYIILYYINTYPDVEMHFQTDMRKKIYQTTFISQRKY